MRKGGRKGKRESVMDGEQKWRRVLLRRKIGEEEEGGRDEGREGREGGRERGRVKSKYGTRLRGRYTVHTTKPYINLLEGNKIASPATMTTTVIITLRRRGGRIRTGTR